jgi:putative FmdB family regulatory protein
MPIFEYTCRACGYEFKDVENANGDETLCPVCTSDELDKVDLTAREADKNPCGASKKPPFR